MKKLFCKFMIFIAAILVSTRLYKWLENFENSLLPFIFYDSEAQLIEGNPGERKTLWWYRVRKGAQ